MAGSGTREACVTAKNERAGAGEICNMMGWAIPARTGGRSGAGSRRTGVPKGIHGFVKSSDISGRSSAHSGVEKLRYNATASS